MQERMHEETPVRIAKTEKLGREEQFQSDAKRAYRRLKTDGKARVRVSKFIPPKSTNEISTNRMDLAPVATMAELGTRNASLSGKRFWGWYTLAADDVEEVGCRVQPSPLDDNPYHADILIPVALDAEDRKDAIREYAMGLAYHADFCPWGDWTTATD